MIGYLSPTQPCLTACPHALDCSTGDFAEQYPYEQGAAEDAPADEHYGYATTDFGKHTDSSPPTSRGEEAHRPRDERPQHQPLSDDDELVQTDCGDDGGEEEGIDAPRRRRASRVNRRRSAADRHEEESRHGRKVRARRTGRCCALQLHQSQEPLADPLYCTAPCTLPLMPGAARVHIRPSPVVSFGEGA